MRRARETRRWIVATGVGSASAIWKRGKKRVTWSGISGETAAMRSAMASID